MYKHQIGRMDGGQNKFLNDRKAIICCPINMHWYMGLQEIVFKFITQAIHYTFHTLGNNN